MSDNIKNYSIAKVESAYNNWPQPHAQFLSDIHCTSKEITAVRPSSPELQLELFVKSKH